MSTPEQRHKSEDYIKLVFGWVKIGDTLVIGDKDYVYRLSVASRRAGVLVATATWREASDVADDEACWFTQPGDVQLTGSCQGVYRSGSGSEYHDGVASAGRSYPAVSLIPVDPCSSSLELGKSAWMHLGPTDRGRQLICLTGAVTRLSVEKSDFPDSATLP